MGALTIGIANNAGAPLLVAAEHPVLIATGSEVIAGSTRMKAGTAQKVVLNLISTAVMIKLGRIYRGRMVNMAARNAKLDKRAVLMVADLAGVDEVKAVAALSASGGDLKLAVMVAGGMGLEVARVRLQQCGGNLRQALAK